MIRNRTDEKISIGKFAKLAGISRSNAWRIVKRREIPAVEIGKRITLYLCDVEDYIAAHTIPAAAPGSRLVDRMFRTAKSRGNK